MLASTTTWSSRSASPSWRPGFGRCYGAALAGAILVVLIRRPPVPSRRRAWPWLLATPLSLLVGLYGFHVGDQWPMVTAWEERTLLPNLALVLVALVWARRVQIFRQGG